MKVLQIISLFLLAASSGVEARERRLGKGKSDKKDKKSGGGGGGGGGAQQDRFGADGGVIQFDGTGSSPFGILEPSDCLPFDSDLVVNTIRDAGDQHDAECSFRNGCEGSAGSPGCCRFHPALLRCDADNDFGHQPVSSSETT